MRGVMRSWIVSSVLLVGCGGSVSEEPVDGGSDSATDAVADVDPRTPCERRADEVCALFDACPSAWLPRWYADRAACIAGERRLCERDLDIPGVIDAAAQIDACSRELAASPRCPTWLVPMFCASARPAGALVDGTPCLYDEQCASSFCSMPFALEEQALLYPLCGHCARRSQVGDPCVFGENQCDTGSTSLRPSGLACDRATSKCVVRPLEGEPCGTYEDCDSKRCDDGRCYPPLVGRLKPAPPPRFGYLAPGAECRDALRPCGAGYYCKRETAASEIPEVCTAPGGVGDRCLQDTACGHVLTCVRSPYASPRCLDVRRECK